VVLKLDRGFDMARSIAATLLATAALAATPAVAAHHSFAAEYDRGKTVTVTGTVTRFDWMNPHIYFYVEVKDEGGKATTWAIEGGAPNTLYRAGWRKDSLKVGDVVTVSGYLARDGSNQAHMQTVVLADGRSLFTGQRVAGADQPGPSAPKPLP
jgi:hypothetical protein